MVAYLVPNERVADSSSVARSSNPISSTAEQVLHADKTGVRLSHRVPSWGIGASVARETVSLQRPVRLWYASSIPGFISVYIILADW